MVVVGAGTVGTRRAQALRDAGADVVVVTAADPFRPADLDGAWLAMACTDDPDVNAAVAAAAEARQIFCVRADLADGGTARTSAVARHDGVTVAVNGGDDPGRAVALRDAITAALEAGDLPARRHRRGPVGSVALVGGGPGDPELITVRGRRLVADADVVVVDRLAPRALLDGLPPDVEVIDCGKSAHRQNLTQAQINDVLVERARAGKRVVRLKGGDPFVFGRGGEEWLACVAAGVPVTVVPGLSSALAGPAAAGIPLTHRGVAADFTVVSGHLDPGRPAERGHRLARARHPRRHARPAHGDGPAAPDRRRADRAREAGRHPVRGRLPGHHRRPTARAGAARGHRRRRLARRASARPRSSSSARSSTSWPDQWPGGLAGDRDLPGAAEAQPVGDHAAAARTGRTGSSRSPAPRP